MSSSNEESNKVPRSSAYSVAVTSTIAIGLTALSGTIALPLVAAAGILGVTFAVGTAINMSFGESLTKSMGNTVNDIAAIFAAGPKYLAQDAKSLLKKIFGKKPATETASTEKEPIAEPATVANMAKLAPLFQNTLTRAPETPEQQQPKVVAPANNF